MNNTMAKNTLQTQWPPDYIRDKRARCVRVLKENADILDQSIILAKLTETCELLDKCCGSRYEKFLPIDLGTQLKDAFVKEFGFCLQKKNSSINVAGNGVFVTDGMVPKHSLVGIYPGTVYQIGEPVLLQSIANPFVFRCVDGVLIDGHHRSLSKLVYSSCSFRDRQGSFLMSDFSWLTSIIPANPLNIGQYVNNHDDDHPANVCYQEINLPLDQFPAKYRRFIPNISYTPLGECRFLRLVVIVSLCQINQGEELFSSYFTAISS